MEQKDYKKPYVNIIDMLKGYPFGIKYIENPTEEMQLLAVKEEPYAIQFIKNPTKKVKALARKLEEEGKKDYKKMYEELLEKINKGEKHE